MAKAGQGKVNMLSVTTSEEIFFTGRDSYSKISLRGDARIPQLVAETKKFISDNGLKLPRDEERVGEHIIQLVHSEKYYGAYDKRLKKIDAERDECEDKIAKLEGKPGSAKKLAELKKEKVELDEKYSEYYQSRAKPDKDGWISLKDFKGNAVCREEVVPVSFAMHAVGIPNECLAGLQPHGGGRHVYIQSTATKKIYECTQPVESCKTPLNDTKLISQGGIVFTHNEGTGTVGICGIGQIDEKFKTEIYYDKGRQVINENISAAAREFVDNAPEKIEKYKTAIEKGIAKGSIKITDLEKFQVYSMFAGADNALDATVMSKGKGEVSAPSGVVDFAEINATCMDDHKKFAAADKNRDGQISPTEIPALFNRSLEK